MPVTSLTKEFLKALMKGVSFRPLEEYSQVVILCVFIKLFVHAYISESFDLFLNTVPGQSKNLCVIYYDHCHFQCHFQAFKESLSVVYHDKFLEC